MLLNLPSLSASSDLNCCDRPLSFFASDLLMLLSLSLSSCEKPMPALPLVEAPALPVLLLPMLSDDPLEEAPPLAPAPVLSDGDDVLLLGEELELDPLAPAPLEPLLLMSPLAPLPLLLLGLLLLVLLGPDWANAPKEASEADIAKVKMSFLFI